EEKRRKEAEEKRQQEEEELKRLSDLATQEDKGQASTSEHDPLLLLVQEQLATQKAEQEKLKEDVKNLSEGQE
ncbi:hypothetical protein A2U01_0105863, partial [Trifolium medium]|nr:hypothetical protein [Trifolium medium]